MAELTDAQSEELGDLLRALEVELNEALARGEEASKTPELDQQSVGRISRMDSIQQQAMAAGARRSTEARLGMVHSAIEMHKKGGFGFCRSCEEPIGYARLKARPETPLCLACKSSREG